MSVWLESWAARLYEPLMGPVLSGLRARITALCEHPNVLAACPGDGNRPRRVLDCCCGPGGMSRLLRERGMEVTGVDVSDAMLECARRRAPGVTFLHADARRLPFADGKFDVAVISLALHSMDAETADAVLHELLRVAAVVIVADFCLAERNLEVPATAVIRAVEWSVGGEHYRNCRRFMEHGGLEGLLYRHRLTALSRAHALGGGATVAAIAGQASFTPPK